MLEPLHEDQDLLVLNKPAGLPVLKDRSGVEDLWSILKRRFKPYQVHRLDKGTSGVLLVAKNQATQSYLTRQFSQQLVHKFYLAVVADEFPARATQLIDLPLCKGRKSRYRVAGPREEIRRHGNRYGIEVDRAGVDAQTRARRLEHADSSSVVLLKPSTGRTHQLRVHLSWLGHPILGDHLYGPASNSTSAPRLLLHAHKLVVPGFAPFKAPIPSEGFRLSEL